MKFRANMNNKRPFWACLAASLTVLSGLSIFAASPLVTGAKADPESGKEPFLVLQDKDGRTWTELDGLDVFANPEFGGRHIVAPFSHGTYDFTVQNNARFPLKYSLRFSEENKDGVPIEYRLSSKSGFVAGSETDWVTVEDLNELNAELNYETEEPYTLEWRWDGDKDDERDTKLGTKAAESEVGYILKIGYSAEQNGDAVGSGDDDDHNGGTGGSNDNDDQNGGTGGSNGNGNQNGSQNGDAKPPKTGSKLDSSAIIALAACSTTALTLTFILRRKRSGDEQLG